MTRRAARPDIPRVPSVVNRVARTLLRRLRHRDGVNGTVAALAGVCAIVLLALFVQTLQVAVERGAALRQRQHLSLQASAAPVLRDDTRVSDARIDTGR